MAEIPCPIAAHAAATPDAPALLGPAAAYTYRELNTLVSTVAKNLRDSGIRRGDIVALRLSPGIHYPVLLLGVIRVGAVAFPINKRQPAESVRGQLASVSCSALVTSEPIDLSTEPAVRILDPQDVLRPRAALRPRSERVTTDRPAVIVMTSGSTGSPKAAVLTYGNLHANAAVSNANLSVAQDDRWLLSLPLFHVSGLGVLFRCLLAGAAAVIPAENEDVSHALAKQSVTHVSLVAAQLVRLLQAPEHVANLAKLKAILLGGSALPTAMLRTALDHELPIYISYGLTETASQMATSRLTALPNAERPSAKVLTPGALRISSESEIEVCGPTLFAGYLTGGSLDRPLTKDGWFRTGDLGRLDASGGLTVVGRKDNMFISGGENIQPEEIESALSRVEGIVQAIVVPVADPEFGHRPVAFVETAPGVTLDTTTLAQRLESLLPRYKIPRRFLEWPADLAGQGLKLNRKLLAERAEAATKSP